MLHLSKKEVGHFLCSRGFDEGTRGVSANDFQGVTNPLGIRVNCTADASARYSFCLEMADLMSPAIRPPNNPIR